MVKKKVKKRGRPPGVKRHKVGYRISVDLMEALRAKAAARRRSITSILEEIIIEYLDGVKAGVCPRPGRVVYEHRRMVSYRLPVYLMRRLRATAKREGESITRILEMLIGGFLGASDGKRRRGRCPRKEKETSGRGGAG